MEKSLTFMGWFEFFIGENIEEPPKAEGQRKRKQSKQTVFRIISCVEFNMSSTMRGYCWDLRGEGEYLYTSSVRFNQSEEQSVQWWGPWWCSKEAKGRKEHACNAEDLASVSGKTRCVE